MVTQVHRHNILRVLNLFLWDSVRWELDSGPLPVLPALVLTAEEIV